MEKLRQSLPSQEGRVSEKSVIGSCTMPDSTVRMMRRKEAKVTTQTTVSQKPKGVSFPPRVVQAGYCYDVVAGGKQHASQEASA